MRRISILLIALLALSGLGGTYPLGSGSSVVGGGSGASSSPSWYCFASSDATVAANQYASFFSHLDNAASWTATDDFVLAVPPVPNGQWIVYSMSVFVTSALAGTEDCLITLHSSPVGGADTDILAVAVGALDSLGNDTGGACEFSVLGADATNVDDVGDYCRQDLASPTVVAVGSGIRFRLNADSAGTCTSNQSVNICVLAAISGDQPIH